MKKIILGCFLFLIGNTARAEILLFAKPSKRWDASFQTFRTALNAYAPESNFASQLMQEEIFSEINRNNQTLISGLSEFLPESLQLKMEVFGNVSPVQQDYILWVLMSEIYKAEPIMRIRAGSTVDRVKAGNIQEEDLPSIIKQMEQLSWMGSQIQHDIWTLKMLREVNLLRHAEEEAQKLQAINPGG